MSDEKRPAGAGSGSVDLAQDLLPLVYDELRRIAAHYLRAERPGHTLQPTALVHEVYLRLAEERLPRGTDRTHLVALAARVMRHVLVDHARARQAGKRGGDKVHVLLDDVVDVMGEENGDLVTLDAALDELARRDAQQARVVELRFFGGLDVSETAKALGVSPTTVKREWAVAKLWLKRQLERSGR